MLQIKIREVTIHLKTHNTVQRITSTKSTYIQQQQRLHPVNVPVTETFGITGLHV